jgi:hypothetical protein
MEKNAVLETQVETEKAVDVVVEPVIEDKTELPKEEPLFELKAIYTQLGGKDNDILTNKFILPVREAIATLRREARKKSSKK